MKIPVLDGRTQRELLDFIKSASGAYTPEWRYDEENPDVGTALSMIYADLFTGTLNRYNQTLLKHRTAFFQEIGLELLPAIPAFGYATFGLADDTVEGVEVRRGTRLLADAEDAEGDSILFETEDDVFVTPARVQEILSVHGGADAICMARQAEGREPFRLFDFSAPNLQKHTFYLSHPDLLRLSSAAVVTLTFYPYRRNRLPDAVLESFCDPQNALWEYETEEGFYPFRRVRSEHGQLILEKSEGHPSVTAEQFHTSGVWLRCTIRNVAPFSEFVIDRVEMAASGSGIVPDSISAVGVEQNVVRCFPFGEKPALYHDVYFACDEALCKKGAQVRLEFNLNFMKIPVDLELEDPSINWKLIMRRSEFKPDRDYDITIEQVIWEYYNGQGWARLYPDEREEDCFSTVRGTMGQFRSIRFRCPKDMEPILIGSCESRYLRARILKLNNAYKTKGNYISPYIDEMKFAYDYGEETVLPEHFSATNQMENVSWGTGALRDKAVAIAPVQLLPAREPAAYFSFRKPPVGGPIRLLFLLGEEYPDSLPPLRWDYWNGRAWKPLSGVDGTDHFRKTGLVTWIGNRDFASCRLFGLERYWIRVSDQSGYYGGKNEAIRLPTVYGLHENAVQMKNSYSRGEERFYVEPPKFRYQLLHGKVQEISVLCDELGHCSEKELQRLESEGRVEWEREADGRARRAWVRWIEVRDFSESLPSDRHYVVDRNSGTVFFSDGTIAKAPPSGAEETVRVAYRTGGGAAGNLPPDSITRTELSIGFVNRVSNPAITAGGCNQETLAEAVRRGAAILSHRYRAVTARDYEKLAFEATRGIWKAKCFAGYDQRGHRENGLVTLVVLQKDFIHGRAFFGAVRRQVEQYLLPRISGNLVALGKFHVAPPQFLELRVKAELTVGDFNHVFEVKAAVEHRLAAFLDPVTGNFDGTGWEIGRLPNETQLLNSLRDIPNIKFVKSVLFTAYTQGKNGWVEVLPEDVEARVFALPLSGSHDIVITVDERR